MNPGTDAEAIQNVVFEVGKRHPFPELRAWFGCLYQVLLGQQEGPRFGGFVALYGVAETVALIEAALSRPADAGLTHDAGAARIEHRKGLACGICRRSSASRC